MNNILLSFLFSLIASFSTLIGIIFIYTKINNDKIISSSLFFSASVMMCVSIIDLIPESYKLLNNYFNVFGVCLFIMISINISFIILSFVSDNSKVNNTLYKVGIISMISIIIHNIPEGIITFLGTNSNIKIGLSLTLSIMMHNIPEGISIAVPVYYSTGSRKKAICYTFLAGFSELLGTILAYVFLKDIINNFILGIILALTSGIMIYISIFELIKEGNTYHNNKKIWWYIFGIILVLFSQCFIHIIL